MEKKKFLLLLRYPLIVLVVAIIGLLVGSFADLSIASSLYMGNKTILSLLGYLTPIAGLFVMSSSGVLLFLYYKNARQKSKRILSYISLLLAPLGGLAYGYGVLTSLSTTLALLAGAFLGIVAGILVYLLLRKEDPRSFFRLGYFYLFSSLTVLFFSLILETVIVRPTYATIASFSEASSDYISIYYKNWFVFNVDKTGLSESTSLDYGSFPSLSASIATLGLLLPALCSLTKKTKGKELLVFLIASALLLIDGVLGLLRGTAFLSDFSFAILIGIVPSFLIIFLARTPKEVKDLLMENKKKADHGAKSIIRKGFRYGAGAQRGYEEQFDAYSRKTIRAKNNRIKKKGSYSGPFFKLKKKR